MQEVYSIKGQIEVREAAIAITEEDWNKKHQQLKEQIHSIDKALSQAAVRRQSIASQVMGDLLSHYDFIFSRRGGTAVVEVKAARDTILHTLYS